MKKKWLHIFLIFLFLIPSIGSFVSANETQLGGNYIKNGDFANGTDHWSTWDGEGGESEFTVEDGTAEMQINNIAGMHPEWNVPISWSTQLFQEGVQLEDGSIYELTFTSRSTIDRPIEVEFTGLSGNPKQAFHLEENAKTFTHEFEVLLDSQMDFKFLVGYVVDGDFETENVPHTIFFEDISIVKVGEMEKGLSKDRVWELVWSDEFEGSELDTSKWNYDIGSGFWSGEDWISGWGNEELQYYSQDNVWVEDGKLYIEARQENASDEHGSYDFTSGKITTEGKFSQTYGRFEASIKLPEGQGYWPAFWMMPQYDVYGGWAASGEIDIMENRGSETNKTSGAIHYGDVWPYNTHTERTYTFPEGMLTTDFNVYSIEWEPGEIRWYVNDTLFGQVTDWYTADQPFPAPFDQEFFLILNLAVGGWFGGDPDETTPFPAQMVVDYVRVYEDVEQTTDPEAEQGQDKEILEEGLEKESSTNLLILILAALSIIVLVGSAFFLKRKK